MRANPQAGRTSVNNLCGDEKSAILSIGRPGTISTQADLSINAYRSGSSLQVSKLYPPELPAKSVNAINELQNLVQETALHYFEAAF